MVKMYNCELCKFSSKTKYNYEVHCKSVKHINNEKESKKCSCENCGNEFANKKYLTYHLKECATKTEKNKILNTMETLNKVIITDKDAQINYLKKIIEQNTKDKILAKSQYEKEKNALINQYKIDKEEYIKSKNNEINFLKLQLSQLYSVIVKPSISAFKHAVINFTSAPSLADFTDFDLLKTENDTILNIMLLKSEKNILHEYIGDVIINCYKKENIAMQSMWNTDCARLSYIIRSKVICNDPDIIEKCEWKIDKNAEIIKKNIILPILQYLKKVSINAAKEKFKEYNNRINNTERDDILLSSFNKKNAQLQQELENVSYISQNIIKHISPHFYMSEKTLTLA